MRVLILLFVLSLAACTIKIDSPRISEQTKDPIKSETGMTLMYVASFVPGEDTIDIMCNDYNVVYYRTSIHGTYKVYTPMLRASASSIPNFVSCDTFNSELKAYGWPKRYVNK